MPAKNTVYGLRLPVHGFGVQGSGFKGLGFRVQRVEN